MDTQRTLDEIQSINLLPAHEFPTDEKGIEFFRTQFRETFGEIRRDPEHIYQQISKGTLISGIEYWQPLFFDEMATLFDYLPEKTLFVDMEKIKHKVNVFILMPNSVMSIEKLIQCALFCRQNVCG